MIRNGKVILEASSQGLITLELGEIPNHKQNLNAFMLTFEAGENRWNLTFTRATRKALSYVRDNAVGQILITRSSSAKFFSNGLDIASLNPQDREGAKELGQEVMGAFADVLELPIPTLCVIQGHAFGAGMMFALSHDYRIQQSGRGFMCANEVELAMPIPKPELDLFAHAMAPIDYFDTVLSAKRWDGAEAYRRGLVHATGNEQEVTNAVVALANRVAHLGKNRPNMKIFKRDTKGHVATGLRTYFTKESKL